MLYLVATPIGNLGDITIRALEILRQADLLAAEDTRRTMKLLNHYEIRTPVVSYYEHNKIVRGRELIEKLRSGLNIALVSDAGTPGISDPGADLVRLAAENEIPVSMAPGPAAGIMALVLSGFSTDRFVFEGFISRETKERQAFADRIRIEKRTVILYEAPHRLLRTLEFLADLLGPDRKIAICRELTKVFEEIRRGNAQSHLHYFTEHAPKGEFVLVLEGASETAETRQRIPSEKDIYLRVTAYMAQGSSKNEAIRQTALEFDLGRNKIYAAYENEKASLSEN